MRFPYAILLTVGCAASRAPVPAADAPSACVLEHSVAARDTVVVGSSEPLDPATVLRPSTPTHRLVFAALYETLIDIDCEGRAVPELASSWSADSAGRRWTFTLRDSARFSDGSPVTAAEVIQSWTGDRRGVLSAPALLAASTARVSAIGNAITIIFDEPRESVPLLLADAAFAVRRPASSTSWPLGTGPHRVADTPAVTASANARASLYLVPLDSGAAPVIELRTVATSDPRDLLDAGADVVITADPGAIAYAATRSELVAHSLPWDRTYVLLSSFSRERPAAADLVELGDALARDAVRVEARGARNPAWWRDVSACVVPAPDGAIGPAAAKRNRIVYPRDEAVARDLAARIVAVAAFGSPNSAQSALASAAPELLTRGYVRQAVGLSDDELALALGNASEYAHILPLPSAPVAPCAALQELVTMAPLLALHSPPDSTRAIRASDLRLERVLVPLVETRSRLLMRRGVATVELAANGTVRFEPRTGTTARTRP